jgi:hypothetical protein
VHYWADNTGFHAEVEYKGHAAHLSGKEKWPSRAREQHNQSKGLVLLYASWQPVPVIKITSVHTTYRPISVLNCHKYMNACLQFCFVYISEVHLSKAYFYSISMT